jgi:hypothetical protein
MNQHREASQYRRVKLLIQEPVADNVLDIVGHHREHRSDEIDPEILVMERCESDPFFDSNGNVLTQMLGA